MPDPDKTHTRRRERLETAALTVVLLLAVGAVGHTYFTTRDINTQIRCQLELNSQFIDAIALHSDSAAQERQAQRELLAPRDAAQRQAALNRYLMALDEADQVRAENPLPARAGCD